MVKVIIKDRSYSEIINYSDQEIVIPVSARIDYAKLIF
jgi:hypothetical protein